MRSVVGKLVAFAAPLAFAAPAYADWEGTKWGMSPNETLAVLNNASSHNPAPSEIFEYAGASYQPLVKLAHSTEGIEGEASLLFDTDGKLQFVVFMPGDLSQCDSLAAALRETHGAADVSGFGSTSILNWIDGENVIRLTNAAGIGICNLSYGAS
ncbi:MAG: hypothetical protein ACK4ZJ_00135 [Allorhizobium sp.]